MVQNKTESEYKDCLSIQVSLDGFSFYTYEDVQTTPQLIHQYHTEETSNPEYILSLIKDYFQEHELDQKSFEDVQVTYYNTLYTVIPEALFDAERLTDYLKYNIKILSTDFLTYDELPDHKLNIVYVPFTNINNYFFDCFGSFTYHHHIGLLLKHIWSKTSEEPSSKQLKIKLRSRDFDLIALEGSQVLLINSFTYQSTEDFLYHILFCYEQLNFNPNVHELQFLDTIEIKSDLYKLLHRYIRNITILKEESQLFLNHY